MNQNFPALVRTLIPYVVGVLVGGGVAAAARYGVVVPQEALHEVVYPVVSGLVAGGYYAAARFLETRVSSRVRKAGRLLLTWAITDKSPEYPDNSDDDGDSTPGGGGGGVFQND